jgi:hypothetical protein
MNFPQVSRMKAKCQVDGYKASVGMHTRAHRDICTFERRNQSTRGGMVQQHAADSDQRHLAAQGCGAKK